MGMVFNESEPKKCYDNIPRSTVTYSRTGALNKCNGTIWLDLDSGACVPDFVNDFSARKLKKLK